LKPPILRVAAIREEANPLRVESVPIRAIGGLVSSYFSASGGLFLEWKTCADTSGSAVGFLEAGSNFRSNQLGF
jgi:hypothetical protein